MHTQGLLKYAWKADPVKGDSCAGQAGNDAATVAANDDGAGTDCAKSWAEGWAFAAAVLPQVHQCDATAATTIKANLDVASAEPMKDGVAAVKTAVESVYACLGITCAQVGGLVGVPADKASLVAPCTTHEPIAGYFPGSDVTEHNKIDLDQAAMETALGAYNFSGATHW